MIVKTIQEKNYINWLELFNPWLYCSTKIKRSDLWHQRFEYVSMQALIIMDKNNFVESMDLNGNHDLNFYDELMYGKHHCTLFLLSGVFCAKEILGFVHINICGPMVTSHEGAKYFNVFIDDFLRKTFLYTMKTKFGVTNKNLVIFNHLLCGYVQFNPAYDYELLPMQLFFKF